MLIYTKYFHTYCYLIIHYHMGKKSEFLSFRTTAKNHNHLKAIHVKYDLPIGHIIHRMIEYFAKDDDAKKTFDELHK